MVDVAKRIEALIPKGGLSDIAERWQIVELSLFGSVLRDDFGPASDVDVLVSFEPSAPWSLWDLVRLQDELGELLGREIDLVEAEGLRNPYRRQHILSGKQTIYVRPQR
ncbi:MAG: nucleotidyltransferase family protein [Pirellulales bacterium]|nr:nucleotidyltransferase family protein [Pirellulales bacterium]